MENNKRNSEIFLGIVGVATLIVAIIGASFSYFVASASSGESDVDLTSYEFNATLTIQKIFGAGNEKMIPIDPMGEVKVLGEGHLDAPNDTNLAYALNVAEKCTDDNNFKVCEFYELTITNNGSEAVTLQGSIVTDENTGGKDNLGFRNLTYRGVTGSKNNYVIGSTATKLATTANDSINMSEITVAPNGGTETVYALLYLEEAGLDAEPQNDEMAANFKGRFVFTSTAATGSKLTGTFTVGD